MKDAYSVDLYYTQMGSDKAYYVKLDCVDKEKDLWKVWAKYGARWNVSNLSQKAEEAMLPLDKALKSYLKLISSKLKKGYTINHTGINGRGLAELGQATEDVQLAFRYRAELEAAAAKPAKRRAL
jgi:hypothetical protein